MYQINTKGTYVISEDLDLSPTNNNVIGIRISSSNVTLNFNEYTINEIASAPGNCAAAIQVDAGLSNIIIKGAFSSLVKTETGNNGQITGIYGDGILVNTGVSNLIIDGITIIGCGKYGINVTSATNTTIDDVIVAAGTGLHPSATDGSMGLRLVGCKDTHVSRSTFQNNGSANINATGAYISNCTYCTFKNCSSVGNTGRSAIGFRITGTSQACSLSSCVASSNTSSTNACKGISIEYSLHNECVGCEAYANASSGSSIYAFYLDNGSYNQINNCSAHNQFSTSTSVPSEVIGFYSTQGTANKFDYCSAIANTGVSTIATATVAGFTLRNGEKNSTISKCQSSNNNAYNGTAYGIMLGNTTDIADVLNCIVRSNKMLYNNGVTAKYGYRDFAINSTTLLQQNLAVGHGPCYPSESDPFTVTTTMNFMFQFTGTNRYPGRIISETDVAVIGFDTTNTNLSVVETALTQQLARHERSP